MNLGNVPTLQGGRKHTLRSKKNRWKIHFALYYQATKYARMLQRDVLFVDGHPNDLRFKYLFNNHAIYSNIS